MDLELTPKICKTDPKSKEMSLKFENDSPSTVQLSRINSKNVENRPNKQGNGLTESWYAYISSGRNVE